MKSLPIVSIAFFLPIAAFAQDDPLTGDAEPAVIIHSISGSQFLIALFSGLLLAYCFQWLLTNLSFAAGISALKGTVDPGKRAEAAGKARERQASHPGEKESHGGKGTGWDDAAVKFGSGAGLWAMITSSIALFLACWLAIELIRLQGNVEAAILGLVIWSAFLGTMLWIESAAASSLLGYVTSTVKSGLGAMFSPVKAAAGRIAEGSAAGARREEAVQTAEEVTAAVRRELFGEEDWQVEGPGLKSKIADYVHANVKPKAMDAVHIGRQFKSLLTDPELIRMAKSGELQGIDRSHFAEIVAGRTDLEKDQVEKIVDALHGTWSRFLGENAGPETAGKESPAWKTSGAMGSAQGMVSKYKGFKEFLRSTGREELSPERLEHEVKTLVLDPGQGLEQLKQHVRELDRESLVKALAAREDMTPEEAGRIADQIELARSRALSAKEQAEHRAEEMRGQALGRIRDQVYAIDRPELDYEGFEGDFKKLLDDPKAGYAALKSRLQGLDRETLVAALSSRPGTSREEAEKIADKAQAAQAKAGQAVEKVKSGYDTVVDKILEAKQTVLERAERVEEEAKRRVEAAKIASLEQAEATRKVAAAAAWWLLGIAVVSGAAAALGAVAGAGT